MNINKNKVCRLCLKTCNRNFETIEDTTKEILEILLVNMDFDISEECVNCNKCLEMIQKCFEFKSICVHTEDKLIVFLESRNINRANMKQVYLDLEDMENKTHFNSAEICRFCMKPITKFFALDEIVDEHFNNMLQTFLPEVTLNVTNNPVSCSSCLDFLKSYFTYLKYLHHVEKHIKNYCEAESEKRRGKVKLNNVAQYILNRISKDQRKNRKLPLEETNKEMPDTKNYCLKSDDEEDSLQNYIKTEEIEINIDETAESDNDSEPREAAEEQTKSVITVRQDKETRITTNSRELVIRLKRENFNILNNKTNRSEENPQKFQCSYCKFKTLYKGNLVHHLKRLHKLRIFSCRRCGYKTRNKNCLKIHKVIHSDKAKFECPQCHKVFGTRLPLDNHLLREHENLYDLITSKIHSCNTCSYKTMRKANLDGHILRRHSRLKKYQCNNCLRSFFQKGNLSEHITSVHLNIRPFMCDACKKTFKNKRSLDFHISVYHKKNVDLMKTITNKFHYCTHCTYKSYNKCKIMTHIKAHDK